MTLLIGLSVVIVAYDGAKPRVLATKLSKDLAALPFGAFDPEDHRTFELALRGWVKEQTGFQLGHVEQLYTFGDRDRESPEATLFNAPDDTRIVSVGYLALTPEAYPKHSRRVGAIGIAISRGRTIARVAHASLTILSRRASQPGPQAVKTAKPAPPSHLASTAKTGMMRACLNAMSSSTKPASSKNARATATSLYLTPRSVKSWPATIDASSPPPCRACAPRSAIALSPLT